MSHWIGCAEMVAESCGEEDLTVPVVVKVEELIVPLRDDP